MLMLVGIAYGQKQSLYSQYPSLAHQDVMNDEYSTRSLGGVPTAITYSLGKASFNGTTSNITYRSVNGVKSVRLKLTLATTTQAVLTLSATHSISVSSGTISATGFSSPTIYVNGAVSSTITTAESEIVITTATAINANTITLGKVSTSHLNGSVNSIQFFRDVKTAQNVADLYTGKYGKDNKLVPNRIATSFKIAKAKTNFVTTPPSSLNENGLVFAYEGNKPINKTIVDISGNGNNGTLNGGVMYAGRIDGGLQFDGVNDYVSVADANSLDFNGTPFTYEFDLLLPAVLTSAMYLTDKGINGFFVDVTSGAQLEIGKQNVAFWQQNISLVSYLGKRTHIVVGYDGTNKFIYINGTSVVNSAQSTNLIQANTSPLYLGVGSSLLNFYKGTIYSAKLYNRALTAQQVKERWNKIANKPYIIEDFSDGTVGKFPRDWTKVSGTHTVQQYSITTGELVTNGNAESALPTINGTAIGNVRAISAQSTEQKYAGSYSVKVTGDATANSNFYTKYTSTSSTVPFTVGKTYKVSVKVYMPSDQTNFNQLSLINSLSSVETTLQSTTTTNTWVELTNTFVYTYSAGDWVLGIRATNSGSTIANHTNYYFYWDDLSVVEVLPPYVPSIKNGTKYLRTDVAGIVAFPSTQAYGRWSFDLYKGADANFPFFQFTNDKNNLSAYNGYGVAFASTEAFVFYKNGSTTFLTANSYIANNTWYHIDIERTTANVFSVYITGGAFTTKTLVSTVGGSGSNPVLDNTYTTSKYFVLDLDAGDRITNIKMYKGIPQ